MDEEAEAQCFIKHGQGEGREAMEPGFCKLEFAGERASGRKCPAPGGEGGKAQSFEF